MDLRRFLPPRLRSLRGGLARSVRDRLRPAPQVPDPDRPLFLIGHGRAGSTATAAVVGWHPDVGPRMPSSDGVTRLDAFLDAMMDKPFHRRYDSFVSRSDTWLRLFPSHGSLFNGGPLEVVEGIDHLDPRAIRRFRHELLGDLEPGQRFLSKVPHNVFRAKAVRALFPDGRFVCLLRNGPEVVSSLGLRREWGFGQDSLPEWTEATYQNLSYEAGIELFTRKWLEVIAQAEALVEEGFPLLLVSYDDLIDAPRQTLGRILEHFELAPDEEILAVRFNDRRQVWKERLPEEHHALLLESTAAGQRRLDALLARG